MSWSHLFVSIVFISSFGFVACRNSDSHRSTTAASQSPTPTASADILIGCVKGTSINLLPTAGWRTGTYTFKITAGSETTECTGPLPLKACSSTGSLTCNNQNFRITESGCALPASAHSYANITTEKTPESVDVEISLAGKSIVQKNFKFTYKSVSAGSMNCQQAPAQNLNVPQK